MPDPAPTPRIRYVYGLDLDRYAPELDEFTRQYLDHIARDQTAHLEAFDGSPWEAGDVCRVLTAWEDSDIRLNRIECAAVALEARQTEAGEVIDRFRDREKEIEKQHLAFVAAAAVAWEVPGREQGATDQVVNTLRYLVSDGLGNPRGPGQGSPAQETPPPCSTVQLRAWAEGAEGEAESKTKGKNINARMLDILSKNPDAYEWTQRQFAEKLGCQSSTVSDTAAWKSITLLREARAAARIAEGKKHNGRRRDEDEG